MVIAELPVTLAPLFLFIYLSAIVRDVFLSFRNTGIQKLELL